MIEVIDDDQVLDIKIKSFAYLKNKEKVASLKSQAQCASTPILAEAILLKQDNHSRQALELLDQLPEDQQNSFEPLILRAQLDWQCGAQDKAHSSFLQAAKSNPYSFPTVAWSFPR